jgi:hypothetical protein
MESLYQLYFVFRWKKEDLKCFDNKILLAYRSALDCTVLFWGQTSFETFYGCMHLVLVVQQLVVGPLVVVQVPEVFPWDSCYSSDWDM